jgi:hypothetical protein
MLQQALDYLCRVRAVLVLAWLQVCGEFIRAHKLILTTQCDYFKKMLAPDQFAEGSTNTVKVRHTAGSAAAAHCTEHVNSVDTWAGKSLTCMLLVSQHVAAGATI